MVYVAYRTTEELFWRKVDQSPGHGPWGDCWDWTACKKKGGYGRFKFEGKVNNAHIYSYKLAGNTIPPGYHIDHLCENPSCVNPKHLEAVTPRENVQRYYSQITHCRRGHEYTIENTRAWRGTRACRTCIQLNYQSRRQGVPVEEVI